MMMMKVAVVTCIDAGADRYKKEHPEKRGEVYEDEDKLVC